MVTSQLDSWFGDCDVMIGNYHSFGHLGLESWVFNEIKTLETTFLRNIMRFQTFDPLSRLSGTLSPGRGFTKMPPGAPQDEAVSKDY